MKYLFTLLVLATFLVGYGCKNDVAPDAFDYHAHVYSPDNSVRHLGDTLQVDVEFESHTGQTVHQVNVRIFNASTLLEVYNKPSEAHVNATSGDYEFQDQVVLSSANGFSAGEWIFQAKVWAESDGEAEETTTVNFQIVN